MSLLDRVRTVKIKKYVDHDGNLLSFVGQDLRFINTLIIIKMFSRHIGHLFSTSGLV